MKKYLKYIIFGGVALAVGLFIGRSLVPQYLGGTVTELTDTLNTFRLNVNAAITDWSGSGSTLSASSTYTTVNIYGVASSTQVRTASGTIDNLVSTGSLKIPSGAGGTTVDASGECTVDSTTKTLNCYTGAAEQVLGQASSSKGWAIEAPAAGDNFGGVFFDATSTISKVACINKSSGDNVTFNYGIGTSRASSTSILFTIGGLACNSASTTTYGVSFNNATIPSNSWIWPTFSAASSTETDITVFYTTNP